VTLSADKPSPQVAGTAVTFTATGATGTAPYTYKWWLTTDNWRTWALLRDWGGTTYTWTPATPGSYQVGVWARSSGNTTEAPEATAGLALTITGLPVTVAATPAAPQRVNTPITLTATVTGGTAPQQCKWWVTPDNWVTYSLLRDWQACTTALPWTPTVPGSYQVGVWVRSSGVTAEAPQGSAGLAYQITPIVPDLRGTYSGSGSATQSGCTAPIDNGVFPFTGSFAIPTQTGATFTGTGTFATAEDTVTTSLNGTVTAAGQVSGTLTVFGGMGGTVGLSGTLVANTLTVSFTGQVREGSNTCNLTGSFTGTRP
jgi:hypothetical protein